MTSMKQSSFLRYFVQILLIGWVLFIHAVFCWTLFQEKNLPLDHIITTIRAKFD